MRNGCGKLFLVPTPVGNLEDITLRALRILKEVDIIYAEDTRTSGFLLSKYNISTHIESYHKFNEHKRTESIVERIAGGESVALVTDAGSPGISDPGFLLTRACIESGIEVEALPGATAFVPALTASGLPADRFCFEGFLPQKKGRQTRLKEIAQREITTIVYESPFRLVKMLQALSEFTSESRQCAVCRELTKLHSECVRGTIKEIIQHYTTQPPKGEIVVIIAGKDEEKDYEKESSGCREDNSEQG